MCIRDSSNLADAIEPLGFDVIWCLDVVGFTTQFTSGAGKLRGVVGVFASNCKNEFGGVAEFVKRGLTIFGGIADCVKVDHFHIRSLFANFIYKCTNTVDVLGGL